LKKLVNEGKFREDLLQNQYGGNRNSTFERKKGRFAESIRIFHSKISEKIRERKFGI
jgi:hypothetical protein